MGWQGGRLITFVFVPGVRTKPFKRLVITWLNILKIFKGLDKNKGRVAPQKGLGM